MHRIFVGVMIFGQSWIVGPLFSASPLAGQDVILERLLQLADDPDPRVRYQSALTLGDVESPRRIEALAKIARRDCADRWVRTAILSAVNEDADNLLIDLMAEESAPAEGMTELAKGLGSIVGARGEASELAMIVRTASEVGADASAPTATAALVGIWEGTKLNEGRKPAVPDLGSTLVKLQSEPYSEELRAAASKLAAVIDVGDWAPSTSVQVADLLSGAMPDVAGTRSDADRLAGLASLAQANASSSNEWAGLVSLLAPTESDEFRVGVLAALSDVEVMEPIQIIIDQFGGFSPSVRAESLDVLFSRRERIALLLDAMESGTIKSNKLDASRRAQLLKYPEESIAERAKRLLEPLPDSGTFDLYEKYKSAAQMAGDPARGVEIHKSRCMQCHRASGVGHDVGPNWASFRANAPDTILLNLLYPSLNILPGFTQYVIELNNGRVAMGIIAASTPSSIVLKRGGGEEETILRRNIKSMNDTALSIMPEGLEDGLTHQDMADLLAFIKTAE